MLVEVEGQGAVRIIRMNNADENRFNRPFIEAINQALDAIESDPAGRSVVFTGAHEKYFSNGLDLNWMLGQPADAWADFLVSFDSLLHRVFTYPKPAVAAMNGHAFAGGLFLSLCTDWRVMREDRGWLCIPEIDLGLDLPPGNAAIIAYAVGTRQADILSLTGKRLSAEEALAVGLVDEIAPADQVLDQALEMARKLGTKNPEQFKRHKLGLRREPARILYEEDPPFIRALVKKKQGK